MSPTEKRTCYVASTTLLLSALEYLIPKPLPFLKLGLANLPLLVVLESFGWKEFLVLALLKVCGSSIISGTLFSYVFLLVFFGGMASAVVMKGVSSLLKGHISPVGCSVLGALASNLIQLWGASMLVYGPSIWVAAPLLLSIGLASSVILGFLASSYRKHGTMLTHDFSQGNAASWITYPHTVPFTLLAVIVVLLALEKNPLPLAISLVALFCAQKASGRKIMLVPSLVLFLSMLVLSLFEPNGKVLFSLGSLTVTEGALKDASIRAMRLVALVSASQSMVALMPHVPGKFFSMLSLTLGYFASFRIHKKNGSFVAWIDASLSSALSGTPKAPKAPRIGLVTTLCVLCALSLIVF